MKKINGLMIFAFILAAFMAYSVCLVSNAAVTCPFKDLNEKHWAYSHVKDMVMYGILKGYSDGSFKPNNTMTRAEFSKTMALALNIEEDVDLTPSFIDVKTDNWAYPYIESVRNYLTGYNENSRMSFKPQSNIIREDAAAAMVRALHLENSQVDSSILGKFADNAKITPSLRALVAICVNKGYMRGSNIGFEPRKTLTRAEASVLLKRIIDKLQPQGTGDFEITVIK